MARQGDDHGGHHDPADLVRTRRQHLLAQVQPPIRNVIEQRSVLKGLATYNLRAGTASPAQTAAIYRVVADLPDVFDAGSVIDRIGRRAHSVGMPMPGQEPGNSAAIYLIIDPRNGSLLQTETAMTRPPSALHLPNRPWVDEYHVVRASRLVPSKGVR